MSITIWAELCAENVHFTIWVQYRKTKCLFYDISSNFFVIFVGKVSNYCFRWIAMKEFIKVKASFNAIFVKKTVSKYGFSWKYINQLKQVKTIGNWLSPAWTLSCLFIWWNNWKTFHTNVTLKLIITCMNSFMSFPKIVDF